MGRSSPGWRHSSFFCPPRAIPKGLGDEGTGRAAIGPRPGRPRRKASSTGLTPDPLPPFRLICGSCSSGTIAEARRPAYSYTPVPLPTPPLTSFWLIHIFHRGPSSRQTRAGPCRFLLERWLAGIRSRFVILRYRPCCGVTSPIHCWQ